jgi:putative ABC transport system permease protein
VQLTTKVDALVPLRLPDDLGWAGDYNQSGLGRLKRGITADEARADLDVVQTRVAPRVSDETHGPATLRVSLTPLSEAVVGGARRGLLLLMGAIGAVLLIAISNLANLSLTRATGRARDAMIRAALGASRARLVRQVLLEQLMIAGVGGALGMGVAWVALRLFVRTAPIDLPRVSEVVIDARVLLFAAVVSIGAGLLTALLPAWRTVGRDLQGSLRTSGLATTGDRGSLRTRALLLAVQVALSVTLLVVTALFGVSFVKLMRVDRGFSADHVLAVDVSLPSSRYEREPSRVAAYDRILAGLQSLPGVTSASWTSVLPLKGQDWADLVTVEGDVRPIFERPIANYRFVAPDFFRALEMPIRRGRSFADADRAPSLPTTPAVISEATAARAWPRQDALGKRFRRGNSDAKPFEVVGIVTDGRAAGIDTLQTMMVYVPYWFRSRASAALVIRTKADPVSLAGDVRLGIQNVDPEIAVGESRPLEQVVDAAFAARRYQVTLFAAFGAAALLIAVIGVYAVTTYGISRRRREMNIRVALGAQASQVLGLVMRQTSTPVAVGAIAGALGAFATGGVVASQLTDVSAHDPLVITAIMMLVGTVGILTCALAARQGLRINPAAALREE